METTKNLKLGKLYKATSANTPHFPSGTRGVSVVKTAKGAVPAVIASFVNKIDQFENSGDFLPIIEVENDDQTIKKTLNNVRVKVDTFLKENNIKKKFTVNLVEGSETPIIGAWLKQNA